MHLNCPHNFRLCMVQRRESICPKGQSMSSTELGAVITIQTLRTVMPRGGGIITWQGNVPNYQGPGVLFYTRVRRSLSGAPGLHWDISCCFHTQ